MTPLVHAALIGWLPLSVVLFAMLPARRAALAVYVLGWLFLPMASYDIPGFTSYNKFTATGIGVMLGILLFDPQRLLSFKPGLIDVPIAAWLFTTIATSVVNGLGLYDGLSSTTTLIFTWGIPYLVGRLYFADLAGLRDLAMAVVIGGLLYLPLCLFEIRMSPILHNNIYGYHQHVFAQSRRFGGWRPTVFMQHGLAVGMWMAMATLVAAWLWRSGTVRTMMNVPMWLIVGALGGVTLLCKSVTALALLAMGLAALHAVSMTKMRIFAIALVAAAPAYMVVRTLGLWSGDELVTIARVIDDSRAASLQVRLDSEDLLIARARQQAILGWGAWGRNRVYSDEGYDSAITDGLWVIVLGQRGLVGLAALALVVLLPMALLARRYPARVWSHPALGPAVALGVVLALFMIDSLFNAMLNPVFILAAGGLASFVTADPPRPQRGRRARSTSMARDAGRASARSASGRTPRHEHVNQRSAAAHE